jgi:tetratricopeptide (TPR) repeat protein
MTLRHVVRYVFLICLLRCPGVPAPRNGDEPPAWNRLMLEGRAATQSGRYSEAERSYTSAVRLLESAGKPDLPLARALYELAYVQEMTGRNSQAMRLLNRAIGILEAAPEPSREELAAALQGLGIVYFHVRAYSRAAEAFQKALDFGPHSSIEQMTSLFTDLSGAYRAQRRYREAETVLSRAEAQLEKIPNADGWLHAVLLTCRGNLYLEQHRLAESEAALRRAVTIVQDAGTPRAETLLSHQAAVSYLSYSLAMTCLELRRYSEAASLFDKALELAESGAPVPPADVARFLNGYARCSRKLGDKRHAAALELKAKAMAHEPLSEAFVVDVSALQRRH